MKIYLLGHTNCIILYILSSCMIQTVSIIRRFFYGGQPENTVLWCITHRVVRPIVANAAQTDRQSLPYFLIYACNNRLTIRVMNKQNIFILSFLDTISGTCLCFPGRPPLLLLLYCRYRFPLLLFHLLPIQIYALCSSLGTGQCIIPNALANISYNLPLSALRVL